HSEASDGFAGAEKKGQGAVMVEEAGNSVAPDPVARKFETGIRGQEFLAGQPLGELEAVFEGRFRRGRVLCRVRLEMGVERVTQGGGRGGPRFLERAG